MVVLETGGAMVTIGSTQYLQPDYLSPLPTTVCMLKIEKKIESELMQKKKKMRKEFQEIL